MPITLQLARTARLPDSDDVQLDFTLDARPAAPVAARFALVDGTSHAFEGEVNFEAGTLRASVIVAAPAAAGGAATAVAGGGRRQRPARHAAGGRRCHAGGGQPADLRVRRGGR